MRFVIFGLTLSSSWGNGHATLWRGLLKALAQRGHTATFYEKDVSYYAGVRDGWEAPANIGLRLYCDLEDLELECKRELTLADVAIVTSYCPQGAEVCRLVLASPIPMKVFYDLDTPVTLDALRSGVAIPYLPLKGLGDFDLVLSFTGGRALDELKSRLGARRVAPLFGWVDSETHRPAAPVDEFRCLLGYLGTFAADRQAALEELLVKPAKAKPADRFVIGGAQYPRDIVWSNNVHFVQHLSPGLHSSFFSSGRATLNVTRRAMAEYGYCPSGRLFEAAACGAAILTDRWDGIDSFFKPEVQILLVSSSEDVLAALALSDHELRLIGEAARTRVLEDHTAMCRAVELEHILQGALRSSPQQALAS